MAPNRDDGRIVVVPLGTELLALTERELAAARARAAELGLADKQDGAEPERLVDAEQLAEITNLPQSWLEEAARQSRIPSITAGKYRRFRASSVIAALTTQGDQHGQTSTRRNVAGTSQDCR